MTLRELSVGQTGEILPFKNKTTDFKRLAEMGLTGGVEITPIICSMTNTLRAYSVNNTVIALRNSLAEGIEVFTSGGDYEET